MNKLLFVLIALCIYLSAFKICFAGEPQPIVEPTTTLSEPYPHPAPSNATVELETFKVVKVKNTRKPWFKRVFGAVKGEVHNIAFVVANYTK